MARTFRLDGVCHCGAVSLRVRPPGPDALAYDYRATESHPKQVELCHCNSCRHATGSLYTSYYPGQRHALNGTTAYPKIRNEKMADQVRRFFCTRCGCHIFKSWPDAERAKWLDESVPNEPNLSVRWGIATGILDPIASIVHFSSHVYVQDTKDGGAACWLTETHRDPLSAYALAGRNYYTGKSPAGFDLRQSPKSHSHSAVQPATRLNGSCLCKKSRLHITPPDLSQDVVISEPPAFLRENEASKKWWLRENNTKYLAAFCACRSCRLTSGFEIQPWAFIPRASITLQHETTEEFPLDFNTIPSDLLTSYSTSQGQVRYFCKTCGATAFTYQKSNPDLVHVAVGLFAATEGARAENWLGWWTEGVGFAEQAKLDRPPHDEYEQNDVVDCFVRDLAAWGGDGTGRSVD